jgi:hypothetical protein
MKAKNINYMMGNLNHFCRAATVFLCTGAIFTASAQDATTFYGPSPYLAFDDTIPGAGTSTSPFSGLAFRYFYLENFEKGYLSTPGVTNSAGTVGSGPYTDSVDADDGVIDGIGSGHALWAHPSSVLTFTFSKDVLEELPTHAGIVWTDVGSGGGYYGKVTFEAFDANSNSLGTIGPIDVGDGSDQRGTAEDRFFGVSNTNGISAIRLSMNGTSDWECDHLQYGRIGTVIGLANASIKKAVQTLWQSNTNSLYQVQWASGLSTNRWNNLGTPVPGNGATNFVFDPVDWNQRYYRVLADCRT